MSNVARVAGQAANTLVKPLNVEEVFSTYLYTGNSTARSITNGIDLAGEGGLTWIKSRSSTREHSLYDTERGVEKLLKTNSTGAEQNTSGGLTSFNSNGFSLGTYADINGTAYGDFASWTFRKAKKFFDVVTYTGNGVAGRTVSHSLNSVPGCIIVKATNNARSWAVYHRGTDSTAPEDYGLYLNETTDRSDDAQLWNDTAPTSTEFTVGTDGDTNVSGRTYVAYLFAHNNNDGTFGPDGDADIIKCGSYQSDGNGSEISVDLGFEPQFVMAKAVSTTGNWHVQDSMRGMAVGSSNNPYLQWNTSDSESADGTAGGIVPTSNGFRVGVMGDINIFNAVQTYIYIAIRRPTAVPTSATEVFDIKTSVNTNPAFTSDHVIDLAMFTHKTSSDNRYWSARLASRGYLFSNAPNAGATNQAAFDFGDTQFGHYNATGLGTNYLGYFWKRAPNYMDVVAFTGTGSNQNVSHNLTVAPEMMWIKSRDAVHSWASYHVALGNTGIIYLNSNEAAFSLSGATVLNNTTPTSSVFTVGTNNVLNQSTKSYIAYLFASLAGISKVGSVTHSGTTNVDCGFTSGASLVMLKRTDSTGDWYWWDSTSGIIAGNDPYFTLNGQAPQVTNTDYIDPLSSGFTITSSFTAGDYIFYAIA